MMDSESVQLRVDTRVMVLEVSLSESSAASLIGLSMAGGISGRRVLPEPRKCACMPMFLVSAVTRTSSHHQVTFF